MIDKLNFQLAPEQTPTFVAAGVIKTSQQIEQYAAIPEIAALVIGSYSWERNGGTDPTGEKRVFVYDSDSLSAHNAVALRNVGHEEAGRFLPDDIKRVQDAGKLAIIAVTTLHGEDPVVLFPELAEWVVDMGADGIELNFSCPNEKFGLLCRDHDKTMLTMEAVRERVGSAYTIAKMSNLEGETYNKGRAVEEFQIDGFKADAIASINSLKKPAPMKNGQPMLEVDVEYAGQSGPIISQISRNNLAYWKKEVGERRYDVWSVGGVDTGYEVYHRKKSGAYLVGLAQLYFRSAQPELVARRLAKQYRECLS
jgi:dihydroorotate dehydrogenase